ncbi:hypothetical protein [Burkholderia sp. SCN-KJ]|uniref:hypothetical protein n=1 Tax=Burkholderia sp. SCN-KJ TaxID=2969248 RepID=UPI0021506A72|nr:hypothetical protein [Burkholderia sp. SCN-KJ]MCR4471180.1 hypothetical protein [Burkholderia sp. SCN-KJ]
MKREQHLVSAIGPATREQLEQWAVEHDRCYGRRILGRRILFGCGLLCLGGLAVGALGYGFGAIPDVERGALLGSGTDYRRLSLGMLGGLACMFGIRGWDYFVRPVSRPVNPYRPIDVTPSDLEARNAAFPGALAYLDAIRHQRRPIVPHDLDVLAMVRRQQQSDQGA